MGESRNNLQLPLGFVEYSVYQHLCLLPSIGNISQEKWIHCGWGLSWEVRHTELWRVLEAAVSPLWGVWVQHNPVCRDRGKPGQAGPCVPTPLCSGLITRVCSVPGWSGQRRKGAREGDWELETEVASGRGENSLVSQSEWIQGAGISSPTWATAEAQTKGGGLHVLHWERSPPPCTPCRVSLEPEARKYSVCLHFSARLLQHLLCVMCKGMNWQCPGMSRTHSFSPTSLCLARVGLSKANHEGLVLHATFPAWKIFKTMIKPEG